MTDAETRAALAESNVARGLFSLNANHGRMFVAQRARVERLEELDATAENEAGIYDPVTEDLRRAAAWEAGEAPVEGGGFNDELYLFENVRQIRALHKSTLPPQGNVFDTARRGDLPLMKRLVEVEGPCSPITLPYVFSPITTVFHHARALKSEPRPVTPTITIYNFYQT